MILGMPVSWLCVEVVSLVLFFACIIHASRQENAAVKLLELFAFVVSAAIFENVGVNVARSYVYDLRRVAMVGSVPLEILFIEAGIWYAAFNLVERLRLPAWARPFAVGFFASVQDMTIDPAAVFDRYALTDATLAARWNGDHPGALGNGILSGQWSWTYPGYEGGFFGIPFFNFSGWMYLMAYFTAFILLGRWLSQKLGGRKGFAYGYPFLASILNMAALATPVNIFMLFAAPIVPQHTKTAELVMLCVNYGIAIALLFVFRKRIGAIDLKADGLVFAVPVLLHLFDIVYAFALGTKVAYVPVLVVSAIHIAYLACIYAKSRSPTSARASARA
jgi:hypothetical protein